MTGPCEVWEFWEIPTGYLKWIDKFVLFTLVFNVGKIQSIGTLQSETGLSRKKVTESLERLRAKGLILEGEV